MKYNITGRTHLTKVYLVGLDLSVFSASNTQQSKENLFHLTLQWQLVKNKDKQLLKLQPVFNRMLFLRKWGLKTFF